MARKQRSDSAEAAAEVIQNAMREIHPPANIPLNKYDLTFFDSIIDEFATHEWTNHQLEVAAMLAQSMADYAANQKELRKEGYMMKVKKKTKSSTKTYDRPNPRIEIGKGLANSILSLRRSLSLHARARAESRDSGKKRAKSKALENEFLAAKEDDYDNLIPHPIMQ